MRDAILWIDTSGMPGRVELLKRDGGIYVRTLAVQERRARDLVPAIDSVLKEAGIPPKELEAIAVSMGPGSFTGLRVGVTAAKTLAYATGAELHALPTFECWLALSKASGTVGCVSDAMKGKVYGQIFRRDGEGWSILGEMRIEPDADLLAALPADATLLGNHILLERMNWIGSKRAVEEWAGEPHLPLLKMAIQNGKYRAEKLAMLEPLYHRGSSAEENPKFAVRPVTS